MMGYALMLLCFLSSSLDHDNRVKCATVPDGVGQQLSPIQLRLASSLSLYELVNYLVDETLERDSKVNNFNIPKQSFYSHVYFACEKADRHLSSVALTDQNGTTRIIGANLVIRIDELAKMFAPEQISSIIKFATECYHWARPNVLKSFDTASSYVSVLRAAATKETNAVMIVESTQQFLKSTTRDAYHFVWEDRDSMDEIMTQHGYKRIICGDSSLNFNPCDWKQVGLSELTAKTLCLYRIINHGESEGSMNH